MDPTQLLAAIKEAILAGDVAKAQQLMAEMAKASTAAPMDPRLQNVPVAGAQPQPFPSQGVAWAGGTPQGIQTPTPGGNPWAQGQSMPGAAGTPAQPPARPNFSPPQSDWGAPKGMPGQAVPMGPLEGSGAAAKPAQPALRPTIDAKPPMRAAIPRSPAQPIPAPAPALTGATAMEPTALSATKMGATQPGVTQPGVTSPGVTSPGTTQAFTGATRPNLSGVGAATQAAAPEAGALGRAAGMAGKVLGPVSRVAGPVGTALTAAPFGLAGVMGGAAAYDDLASPGANMLRVPAGAAMGVGQMMDATMQGGVERGINAVQSGDYGPVADLAFPFAALPRMIGKAAGDWLSTPPDNSTNVGFDPSYQPTFDMQTGKAVPPSGGQNLAPYEDFKGGKTSPSVAPPSAKPPKGQKATRPRVGGSAATVKPESVDGANATAAPGAKTGLRLQSKYLSEFGGDGSFDEGASSGKAKTAYAGVSTKALNKPVMGEGTRTPLGPNSPRDYKATDQMMAGAGRGIRPQLGGLMSNRIASVDPKTGMDILNPEEVIEEEDPEMDLAGLQPGKDSFVRNRIKAARPRI